MPSTSSRDSTPPAMTGQQTPLPLPISRRDDGPIVDAAGELLGMERFAEWAEFIVRAVNNHDALAAALERLLLTKATHSEPTCPLDGPCACCQARAALAAARGAA